VILGYFGKLLLKQVFEACKDDRALSIAIIVDSAAFNLSISFF
jgi:hypothetical protein